MYCEEGRNTSYLHYIVIIHCHDSRRSFELLKSVQHNCDSSKERRSAMRLNTGDIRTILWIVTLISAIFSRVTIRIVLEVARTELLLELGPGDIMQYPLPTPKFSTIGDDVHPVTSMSSTTSHPARIRLKCSSKRRWSPESPQRERQLDIVRISRLTEDTVVPEPSQCTHPGYASRRYNVVRGHPRRPVPSAARFNADRSESPSIDGQGGFCGARGSRGRALKELDTVCVVLVVVVLGSVTLLELSSPWADPNLTQGSNIVVVLAARRDCRRLA